MIISASRRCDIPAMFSQWFINRLSEKFALVPNPFNSKRYQFVDLSKESVDIIVFWTKNPRPIMRRLFEIDDMGYKYYFQFTLTPYDKSIETNLPNKDILIKTFIELSKSIGKNKVVWRYDPIILNDIYDLNYHKVMFEKFASKLSNYTNLCYISFVDNYKNISKDMNIKTNYKSSINYIKSVAKELSIIASNYGLEVFTCAENIDLTEFNIQKGSCINKDIIENILNGRVTVGKDKNQRKECKCLESIDIGTYNCCTLGCKYCYANQSELSAKERNKLHNKYSQLLIGSLAKDAIITKRDNKSVIDYQLDFFSLLNKK